MNLRYYTLLTFLAALAVGGALLAPSRAFSQEQGYEELTRGPVHEAFAGSVSFDPEVGMLVRSAPPELIEEIPPKQQLEGDNVAWIPGYWGWEEEQNDFIWISGIWRNLPPGRQWVPGYWSEAGEQWQWTSGYWADEEAEEVAYLPEPPKSIETGPNVEAPSTNHIWISGTWVNRQERYAWRPGYWEPGQQDWTWIPAHYQWTRLGYVFIDGYWDYNVVRRGVIFAPVRFQRSYYSRPNYSYTPLLVISLNVFANHLFVRPSYGHYYFGDYYAPRYRNDGFYASYSYHSGRRGYDPIYAHDRWQHRSERDWERRRSDNYNFYRDNEDARPPRTWASLSSRPEGSRRGQRDDYEYAQPLSRYAERKEGGQRFQTLSKEKRITLVSQRQEVRKFAKDRQQMETRAEPKVTGESGTRSRVKREKLAKSPLVAKRAEQLSGKDVPPKRKVVPERPKEKPKSATEPIRDQAPKRQIKPDKKQTAQPAKRQSQTKPATVSPSAKRQVAEAPKRVAKASKHQVAEAPRRQVTEASKQARETTRSAPQKKATPEEESKKKKKKD
jgi:hypothetical protein